MTESRLRKQFRRATEWRSDSHTQQQQPWQGPAAVAAPFPTEPQGAYGETEQIVHVMEEEMNRTRPSVIIAGDTSIIHFQHWTTRWGHSAEQAHKPTRAIRCAQLASPSSGTHSILQGSPINYVAGHKTCSINFKRSNHTEYLFWPQWKEIRNQWQKECEKYKN